MYSTRQTLIERLRTKSDEDSWQTFTDTYQRYIYVVIRRMNIGHSEAEDLVQEVLIKIWNKLASFNYDPGKAKFRTWLSAVIKNHVFNYVESRKSYSNKIEKAGQQPQKAYTEDEIDAVMQKEWEIYITNLALEKIKGQFTGNAIKVFEMSLAGVSVSKIAEKLEIKENTAYRLKNRVKSKIIEEIEQLRFELE